MRSLKAIGAGLRIGWLILGAALILIIGSEAGLRLASDLKDRYRNTGHVYDLTKKPSSVSGFLPHPYVHWRHPPFQGQYLNVNRDGLRATWSPPPGGTAADRPPVRVFTFGGSTMWGSGARDDYTIPSHLSKLLYAKGYRAEVTNYGEIAYVSTQGVITLLHRIQRGDVPDIALFYQGIDDLSASYEHGTAGLPRHGRFWRLDPNRGLSWAHGQEFLSRNFRGFHRLVTGLWHRVRPAASTRPQARPLGDEVARQTVHVYESNLTFIELLGRGYGFEPLFYWQPTLFSKQYRSPREQAIVERAAVPEKLFDDIYQRVQRSEALNGNPHFHDISDLFDDSEEPYYFQDAYHLSEPGNQQIAAAMVDDLIELIERHRAAAAESAMQ